MALSSIVSVTHGKLQSVGIKWKIPDISGWFHKF